MLPVGQPGVPPGLRLVGRQDARRPHSHDRCAPNATNLRELMKSVGQLQICESAK